MSTTRSAGRSPARIALVLPLALLSAAACGQPGDGSEVAEEGVALGEALAMSCAAAKLREAPTGVASARIANATAGNGLSGNGLCQNGLGAAGLNLARMNASDFAAWFNQSPRLASTMMKYLYRCAAPPWQSVTWTNPGTGFRYTWSGGLGLAPGWANGAAPTTDEQQLITACLAALTNKYGISVQLAIEGRSATGAQISINPGELSTYSVREGCFFGNVFAGQGFFVGLDRWPFDSRTSSARACALDTRFEGSTTGCPPIYQVGYCRDLCVLDATRTFYETCTLDGVTYRPLTTRISPSDVYWCGDGVCQFTESCGWGYDADHCGLDCGPCP